MGMPTTAFMMASSSTFSERAASPSAMGVILKVVAGNSMLLGSGFLLIRKRQVSWSSIMQASSRTVTDSPVTALIAPWI